MKYTISVDFDGTIVKYAFPEIGELQPGAKEALIELSKRYTIVISSCRASQLFRQPKPPVAIPDQIEPCERDFVQEMKDFLIREGIPFDRIDMGDEGKVVAVAYIDDRAHRYDNNWSGICRNLMK